MATDWMASAALLDWLLRGALASGAAIVLVFLLRVPVRRACGAGAAYLLWLLVPAAALAPLLPRGPAVLPEAVLAPIAVGVGDIAQAPHADGGTSWLLPAWAAGALALLLLQLLRQWRFRRALGPLQPRGDGAFAARVDGPAVLGLLRPRIVVPHDFEARFGARERALVIAHERVHLRRGDVPATALATLLQCLFWFDPLVHLALARFRRDQELACDAVVVTRHPNARRDYAQAMLNSQLAAPGLPVGCTWQSGHPLKERIMLLKSPVPGRLRRGAGVLLALSLAIGAGLAVAGGASDTIPAADPETSYARMSPPRYPQAAIDAKMSGKVVLRVLVGADGLTKEALVETSDTGPLLEQAAIDAVKSWEFNPAKKDGQPVEGWVLVPIEFSLDEDAPPAQPVEGALDTLHVRNAKDA